MFKGVRDWLLGGEEVKPMPGDFGVGRLEDDLLVARGKEALFFTSKTNSTQFGIYPPGTLLCTDSHYSGSASSTRYKARFNGNGWKSPIVDMDDGAIIAIVDIYESADFSLMNGNITITPKFVDEDRS